MTASAGLGRRQRKVHDPRRARTIVAGVRALAAGALVLVGLLAGCANVPYPVDAPTWVPGEWWAFEGKDGGQATLVVLVTAGDHTLLAKVPGLRPEPVAGATLLAINRTTFRQDASWTLGRDGAEWTLEDPVAAGTLPLVRFPLKDGDSWSRSTSSGGLLSGSDQDTRITVTGDHDGKVAGKTEGIIDMTWKRKVKDNMLGLPAGSSVTTGHLDYAPRIGMVVRYDGAAVFSGKQSWLAPDESSSAHLVDWGHLQTPPVDGFLRSALEALPDFVVQTAQETAIPVGEPLFVRVRLSDDDGPCPMGTVRGWVDGRVVASEPTYRVDTDGCVVAADLVVGASFAGEASLELQQGGVDKAAFWPLRAGPIVTKTGSCTPQTQVCQVWSATPAAGEKIWVRGRLSAQPVILPVSSEYVLSVAGVEVERHPYSSNQHMVFATVGDGRDWTLSLTAVGLYDYAVEVAVVPPA